MPKRIDKLTDEQKARFSEWRDRWIAIGLQTGETDWKNFEKGARDCYRFAGLAPPKRIFRVESPLVLALAAPIAAYRIADRLREKSDGAVHGAVGRAVRGAVDIAVDDAVDIAVDIAVGDVVRGAVR